MKTLVMGEKIKGYTYKITWHKNKKVLWVCVRCAIVVFHDHTHLLLDVDVQRMLEMSRCLYYMYTLAFSLYLYCKLCHYRSTKYAYRLGYIFCFICVANKVYKHFM